MPSAFVTGDWEARGRWRRSSQLGARRPQPRLAAQSGYRQVMDQACEQVLAHSLSAEVELFQRRPGQSLGIVDASLGQLSWVAGSSASILSPSASQARSC